MSDETRRDDADPALQVANELRTRLRSMPGDELVELTAQLLTTYVVEGVVSTAKAGDATGLASDTVGEETFAQLLKRLKAAKQDPVLERFIVDGENISVRIDGQGVLPITEYRRPQGTPPSRPGMKMPAAGEARLQTPAAPPQPQPATKDPQKPGEERDRFTLIELE